MIVEDSPATIRQYKDQIQDRYDVDFFEDARSAYRQYLNAKYDLVITDLMLPLKSGEGLIFDIKYANPNQKIVVVSGSPESLQLNEYDNIQVFEKPVDITAIMDSALLGKVVPIPTSNLRRKHPRYNVDLKGVIVIPNRKERIAIHITNVSLGGLFIEGKLPTDIDPEAVIELPLLHHSLTVRAEKRWEKEGFGVGVKFNNIGHSEYSLLELYLESLKVEASD
jgi:CheY-like chemotaxis protein